MSRVDYDRVSGQQVELIQNMQLYTSEDVKNRSAACEAFAELLLRAQDFYDAMLGGQPRIRDQIPEVEQTPARQQRNMSANRSGKKKKKGSSNVRRDDEQELAQPFSANHEDDTEEVREARLRLMEAANGITKGALTELKSLMNPPKLV